MQENKGLLAVAIFTSVMSTAVLALGEFLKSRKHREIEEERETIRQEDRMKNMTILRETGVSEKELLVLNNIENDGQFTEMSRALYKKYATKKREGEQ